MTYRLRYRQQALDDIDQIVYGIAHDSEQNAAHFRDRVIEAFEHITIFPFAFQSLYPDEPRLKEVRRGFIRKQPKHLFLYRIEGRDIIILRVVHAARGDLGEVVSEAGDR